MGYIRLLLVGIAATLALTIADDIWFRGLIATLLGISLLLDGLDGYLARKFGHASHFGALLDLALDLMTHTMVWFVSGFPLAVGLIMLEWTAGLYIAAFALQTSTSWKLRLTEDSPAFVRYYFSHKQRNFVSIYANASHFLCPMAWYLGLSWLGYLTIPGLLIYEAVTAYMLYGFNKILIDKQP